MFDIQQELKKLPAKPGVYLMHNSKDEIIYVGKAIKLCNRVRQYFQDSRNLSVKIQHMVKNVAVDWGGTLVSLIVVTAFPEEEMNQIRDVINELYQLIGEKEDVNMFIRFETIQEVLKVFHES